MRVYLIIPFLLGMLYVTLDAGAQDKEGFVLVKRDGKIAVYERWLNFPSSNPPVKVRELKAVFVFNNTCYAGLRLLRDETKIFQWQSHVSEFKIHLQRDTTTWLEYSYHDIPWPVNDQDHFMEYKVRAQAKATIVITFKSKDDERLAPVRKGVTRMQLAGSWTLEQINPTQVKVTYRITSKPIGIPKVFTDPIIHNNIVTTLQEFIRLVEDKGNR